MNQSEGAKYFLAIKSCQSKTEYRSKFFFVDLENTFDIRTSFDILVVCPCNDCVKSFAYLQQFVTRKGEHNNASESFSFD